MNTAQLRQKILDLAIHGKLVDSGKLTLDSAVVEPAVTEQSRSIEVTNSVVEPVETTQPRQENCHTDSELLRNSIPKDEEPFELPQGWKWTRLGEIGTWQSGTTPNRRVSEYYNNGTIPWLNTGDLTDNYIKNIPNKITEFAFKKTSLKLNPVGAVCIAMYGATIGKLGILTFPATTNQACCVCSNFKNIENKYLFYFLMQHKNIFIQQGFGGAQPNISKEKIVSTLIPLPPLSEQKLIVAKIEQIFAQIDFLEQNKEALKNSLKLAKSKILDLAIHGKLVPQDPNDESSSVLLEKLRVEKEEKIAKGELKRDKNDSYIYKGSDNRHYEKFTDGKEVCIDDEIPFDVPEGWKWASGNEIFLPMTSKKPSGKTFRYIDIDSTENKNHKVKNPKELEVSKAPSRASRELKNGDILFSLVRPYLENIAFIDEKNSDCIASTGFYICRPNNGLYPKYAFYLMTSAYVVKGMNQFMKGDNSPSISGNDIQKWLYPLPPLSEQKLIVAKIEEMFEQLDQIQRSLI